MTLLLMRQSNLFTVGRLDQKQTISLAISSNLTHQLEPVEIGDCLGLRQHRLRESLKSASPIGGSIRCANNTLAIRLSKRRFSRARKHCKLGPVAGGVKPPSIPAVQWPANFDAQCRNNEWVRARNRRSGPIATAARAAPNRIARELAAIEQPWSGEGSCRAVPSQSRSLFCEGSRKIEFNCPSVRG